MCMMPCGCIKEIRNNDKSRKQMTVFDQYISENSTNNNYIQKSII